RRNRAVMPILNSAFDVGCSAFGVFIHPFSSWGEGAPIGRPAAQSPARRDPRNPLLAPLLLPSFPTEQRGISREDREGSEVCEVPNGSSAPQHNQYSYFASFANFAAFA